MSRDDGAVLPHGRRNSGYPRRSGYAPDPYGFYVEPRWVVHLLLDAEPFVGEVLDPCCGLGTIPAVCLERGIPARGSDLIDRRFGEVRDMWSITEKVDNIISNPPYGSKHDGRMIHERVEHCLTLVRRKLALILPLTFWESRRRHGFFQQYPPVWFAPCSDRPSMPPGTMAGEKDRYGAIVQPEHSGGTAPYGWFLWEPGYRGDSRIRFLGLRAA